MIDILLITMIEREFLKRSTLISTSTLGGELNKQFAW